MVKFAGRAREQALRVLAYAAPTHSAALVDLITGEIALAYGQGLDRDQTSRAARALGYSNEKLLAIGETRIACRVGSSLALVVSVPTDAPALYADRLEKACVLLTRMLHPGSASPPDEPQGAPAELSILLRN